MRVEVAVVVVAMLEQLLVLVVLEAVEMAETVEQQPEKMATLIQAVVVAGQDKLLERGREIPVAPAAPASSSSNTRSLLRLRLT
jgi:hypothetical protein